MKVIYLSIVSLLIFGHPVTAISQTSNNSNEVKGFQEELKITIDKPKSFNTSANPNGTTLYYQHFDASNKTFYVEPYILIDFKKARSLFDSKCSSRLTSSKKHTVSFPIHFYPGNIFPDAVERITKKEGKGSATASSSVDVVPFPYRRYNLEFGYSRPSPLAVYSSYKGSKSQPTVQLLKRQETATIYETCSTISEILESQAEDINVTLELETRKFDSLDIKAHADLFIAEIIKRDFDRNEQAKGSLTYRSASRGRSGGILGGLLGASSSSSVSSGAVDSRRRYITATALADSLNSFQGKVQTDIIRQGVDWDQDKIDSQIEKMTERAMSFFEKKTAYFRTDKDCNKSGSSGYCLVIGASERPVSSSEWKHVASLVSEAAANNEFELSGDCVEAITSTTSGGTSNAVSSAKTSRSEAEGSSSKPSSNCKVSGGSSTFGDINLSITGDAEKKWIPTSFDVYGISQETLDKSVSFGVTERIYQLEGANAVKPIKVSGEYSDSVFFEDRKSKLEPFVTSISLEKLSYHSASIDHERLKDYCSDVDGCQITMKMESWSAGSVSSKEVASNGPFAFYYNDITGNYRSASSMGDKRGVAGDNVAAHAGIAWGCFFTDALYKGNAAGTDRSKQFYILASHRQGYYPFVGKVCTIVIRD